MDKFDLLVVFLVPNCKGPGVCNRVGFNDLAFFPTSFTSHRVYNLSCATTSSTAVSVRAASLGASLYRADDRGDCADEDQAESRDAGADYSDMELVH